MSRRSREDETMLDPSDRDKVLTTLTLTAGKSARGKPAASG